MPVPFRSEPPLPAALGPSLFLLRGANLPTHLPRSGPSFPFLALLPANTCLRGEHIRARAHTRVLTFPRFGACPPLSLSLSWAKSFPAKGLCPGLGVGGSQPLDVAHPNP